MGAALGHIETEAKRPLGPKDGWFVALVHMDGKSFDLLQVDLPIKGWVVDAIKFRDLQEWLAPTVIPLKPQMGGFLFSNDGDRATRQLNEWKHAYEGDVCYLLVPDAEQKDGVPWLAQPVPVDWLKNKTIDWIQEQYLESEGDPTHLMYRAAYIARTGTRPQSVAIERDEVVISG